MIDIARLVETVASGPLPQEPYIAALPMYDWPEVRSEVDALWAEIRDAVRARGIAAPEYLTRRNGDMPGAHLPPNEFDLATLWRHPNLLLAQTCWGPMEAGLAAHVRVVGQEDYTGVEGGEGAFYSSAIVMRRGETPASGSYAGLRLAYNDENSMSGYLALKRDLERQGAGLDIFAERIVSGGHRYSLRMVARGEADVAAIDCRSWALAKQHEPAARELDVVGWTTRRLGLPFVMTGLRSA